jgi:DNA-directed RNA polymerase subunit E'/Rpb7
MTTPYINTYLNTTVRIHPNQMDNNIRKHIKNSLEKEHLNKCFLDYGYLNKINEINPDYDAEIVAEDPMACALFKVRFSCTLCRPILNDSIICKAVGITPPIIYLVNGPLDIIVKTSQNLNKNVFVFNQKINNWTAKKDTGTDTDTNAKNKYQVIEEGMYLKVKIINKKIIDKADRILCTGYLENIATEQEIKDSLTSNISIEKYGSMKEYLDVETRKQKDEEDRVLAEVKLSELSDLSNLSDLSEMSEED